jgi:hypothetical protein
MRSVILMCSPARLWVVSGSMLLSLAGLSQVNSPYSRFGIGDLYGSRNAVSKGMGGLATAYRDIQSVNFVNPASYSNIGFVTFDVGMEGEFRTLNNQAKTERFESSNLIFNYAALGVPLMKNKKEKTVWGMAFGLRPYSRIRYDIVSSGREAGIDSIQTEYKGNGGLYNAFLGTGFRIGNLSLGINGGFIFGQKELSTYRSLINDSVFYYTAAFNQTTSINKFALDAGLQYDIKVSKQSVIRIGATGFLGGDATATRDRSSQTVFFNQFGGADSIDVVARDKTSGTYTLPTGYSVSLAFEKLNNLFIGAEYETSKWSDLSAFGQSFALGDITMLRFGGHWIPNAYEGRNYFKQVIYRAGMFTGKDYVVVDGKQLPVFGVSFGAGLPIKRYNAYSNQFNTLNISFEYGRRGGTENPYFEKYFRLNFGMSLSDIWFIKRQYD